MPHFTITGTGRSGTLYMARALTSIGIATGHEAVFHRWAHDYWREHEGDVSWFVLPWLDLGIPKDWPVVHITRDPCKVIASWFEVGFSEDLDYPLLERWKPDLMHPTPPDTEEASASERFERVCAFYDTLIDIALKYADATYKLEDLNWEIWREILTVIGHPEERNLEPIWELPRDVNHTPEWHRPRWKVPGGVIPWRCLPSNIQEKALLLGYEKTAGDSDVIDMLLDRSGV